MMLKVAIKHSPVSVFTSFERQEATGEIYNATGLLVDLITNLLLQRNESFQFIEATGYGGFLDDTGNVTGVIGQLYRGEVDIAAMDLSITSARMQYVDFLFPLLFDKYIMIMNKDTAVSSLDTGRPYAMASFSPFTWLVLFIFLFITPIITQHLAKFTNKRTCGQGGSSQVSASLGQNRLWVWFESFYRMSLEQGITLPSTSTSICLILSCYWLAVIVLAASYSGQLTAISTIPSKQHAPVNTLDDLGNSDYYQPYIMEGDAIGQILMEAKFHVANLGQKLSRLDNRFPQSNLENLKVFHNINDNPEKVLIVPKINGLHYLARYKDSNQKRCDFIYSDDLYITDYITFAVRPGMERDIFYDLNTKLINLYSTRVFLQDLQHQLKEYNCQRGTPKAASRRRVVLDRQDLASVFNIWLLGAGAGAIALIIELVIYQCLGSLCCQKPGSSS